MNRIRRSNVVQKKMNLVLQKPWTCLQDVFAGDCLMSTSVLEEFRKITPGLQEKFHGTSYSQYTFSVTSRRRINKWYGIPDIVDGTQSVGFMAFALSSFHYFRVRVSQ